MVYEPLVVHFGNIQNVNIYPRALCPIVALMGALALPAQSFISWKIVRLQQSFWIGSVIGMFSAVSFAGSILSAFQIREYQKFTEKRALTFSAVLWLAPGAAADIIIACSLSYSLYKRRTGLRSTDAVLRRIIRLTLQTGLITCV
ncbi:hypothetical protein HYPSUDRAFT_392216 [Hypholoma sublateritium FD-334 SS-4]|uniref:DUF6534 domain-containing protein n=1 Tax=Hypholoma sublateritium (strain FD-334 SS-4) TaxID=945553 RepID=A0A0D2LWQ2_HYPSF|nr:hypothetical protein HYPSUDRAFT_392216 [Hypholoma sublateritium FD-334 SS-4]